MGIDWDKNCKDAMWSCFWLTYDSGRHIEDDEQLKDNVARLIRMATQKTAGQKRPKDEIQWDALTPTLMNIAIIATAMCLDGRFGPMPDEIDK